MAVFFDSWGRGSTRFGVHEDKGVIVERPGESGAVCMRPLPTKFGSGLENTLNIPGKQSSETQLGFSSSRGSRPRCVIFCPCFFSTHKKSHLPRLNSDTNAAMIASLQRTNKVDYRSRYQVANPPTRCTRHREASVRGAQGRVRRTDSIVSRLSVNSS